MDCIAIPVIAALAASGVPVSHADIPAAPRGAITIAQIDADGAVVSERSQSCSAINGCSIPVHVGRAGLERIRLVVRPDGASGMHIHPVVEDERGRELDLPSARLCWRSSGLARGSVEVKPLSQPGEARGLRLPKPVQDEAAEVMTLAIAITPGL
ncbi:MAG: hypothetical protein ABWZ80_03015 [Beijerinckiaceae bacterium]